LHLFPSALWTNKPWIHFFQHCKSTNITSLHTDDPCISYFQFSEPLDHTFLSSISV
jgi:hypothetical protein